MTGYLRQYIPNYAAVVKPLQLRKTCLNKAAPKGVEGNARKRMAGRTSLLAPTPKELNAFHQLQSPFASPRILGAMPSFFVAALVVGGSRPTLYSKEGGSRPSILGRSNGQGSLCSRVQVIPLMERCEKRSYRSLFL